MRIVIFCDMEGISGIWCQEQVTKGSPMYREACGYMTQDVNACIRGCIAGGAKHVTVRDVHAQCANLLWGELDPRADYLVAGAPGLRRFDCVEGAAGLILLGYHAMAGTPQAVLAHTAATGVWHNCWLNGTKVGEFALDAARAGPYGVPVIMTSGDDKLCVEARGVIGDVVAVAVKEGRARESAKLLTREKALENIYKGALESTKNLSRFKPYTVDSPVRVRLEFVHEVPPTLNPSRVTIIDGRTCEANGNTVEEAVNALLS